MGARIDVVILARRFTLLLFLLAISRSNEAVAQASGESFPQALDDYIASSIKQFEIPGAAVAVVKEGRIVVAKGYGVRTLGKPEPVDADTIFDIASLTKSFTAAAIASMVDEGLLDWDKPVRSYMPALEFSDPYLTANVTLRDLLCHRTGIRNNAAPFRGHLSRAQVIGLFKSLEPVQPFRTRWEYSNIGYALAGEIAASVSGSSWEQIVTRRLIEPLGMSRTTAYFDAAPAMENIADGHVVTDGVQRVALRGSERLSTAAAGAVQSSARDLATWLLFQLGDGTLNGKRILSMASMAEMHAPQVYVPSTAEFRKSRQLEHFAAYGFGWQVWDYRSHYMLWHTGNGDGQLAYMLLLPDSKIGIAVLTNSWRTSVLLNLAMAQRIMDHYLDLSTRDYVAEYRESWRKSAEQDGADERALESSRLKNTSPSLPLSAYAGKYQDALGLEILVTLEKGTLALRYSGGATASLTHWHRDTFRLSWANPFYQGRPAFASFDIDERGKLGGLRMELMRDKIAARRK